MSIVRQGTLPVGSLDHAITLNVQSSGGSHFETVTDTTPYLHRASPQDVASSMKLKKVVGGTIAWNQIGGRTKFPDTHGENGISISWTDAETVSISGTASSVSWIYVEIPSPNISANNHVYIALTDNMPSDVRFGILQRDGVFNYVADGVKQLLFKNTAGIRAINFGHPASIAYNYTCHPQLFDLTQMFGSTIADYIYSLEQAHAGDGVAWFRKLFPKAYYPYNAGELMSVKTSARKTYNADNVEIGSYPLDSDLELRGIPKLDSNNELYYDGDIYASDGTVQRKYGTVTFNGSETWHFDNYNALAYTNVTGGVKATSVQFETCLVDDNAELISTAWARRTVNDGTMGMYYGQSRIFVKKSTITSANDAKTYFTNNPTNVIYALETPTTESADAYTQSQRVGATEEFVDARTVEIPVGNVSEYKRLIQGDTP